MTEYESGLDDSTVNDSRYEFRLRALVGLAPKDPDAVAMQFTRYEDMTTEEREAVEKLGRRGQVITRDRKQPVSGLRRLMPKPAAAQVDVGILFTLNQNHFTAAWRRKGIRPPKGDPNPHHTNTVFCEYDEPRSRAGTRRRTRSIRLRNVALPRGAQRSPDPSLGLSAIHRYTTGMALNRCHLPRSALRRGRRVPARSSATVPTPFVEASRG